jgi:hypothetical protein
MLSEKKGTYFALHFLDALRTKLKADGGEI